MSQNSDISMQRLLLHVLLQPWRAGEDMVRRGMMILECERRKEAQILHASGAEHYIG